MQRRLLGGTPRWRVTVLLAAGLVTLLAVPRAPAKVPFDPTLRQILTQSRPNVVVLGNCLAACVDERVMEQALGESVVRVSMGGSFPREWYLLLRNSVWSDAWSPHVVVIPFVGDEFEAELAVGDVWEMRRTERYIADDGPPDPIYSAMVRRSEGLFGTIRRLAWRTIVRPAAAATRVGTVIDLALLAALVPPSLVPLVAPPGPNVPKMETGHSSDPRLNQWLSTVVSARLNQSHFRPGIRFQPQHSHSGLAPAERVQRTFVPAILDLADTRGVRIVLARVPSDQPLSDDDESLLAVMSDYTRGRGHVYLDLGGSLPADEQRQADPRGVCANFTRTFAGQIRDSLQ